MTEPLDEDICRDDCTSGCHATDCEHHGHATRATLPVPGAGVTAEPLTDTLDVEQARRCVVQASTYIANNNLVAAQEELAVALAASAAPTPDHEPWCYRRHAGDCVDGRDPEMDYEMRDRMLAIASSNLAARAARPPSDCACGWPGCSGQCHTGTSCPCHPMTTDSQWGGKRLYQCPGCWSWGIWPNPVDGDNECECGERLMCVDLREYALRKALAALAATREETP